VGALEPRPLGNFGHWPRAGRANTVASVGTDGAQDSSSAVLGGAFNERSPATRWSAVRILSSASDVSRSHTEQNDPHPPPADHPAWTSS
jgi:hypothetical protein